MYTKQTEKLSSPKHKDISLWYRDGALHTPNGNLLNSYKPKMPF